MRRIVLSTIRTLGRFAVLPVVLLAVLAVLGWVSLFDSHPFWALAIAPLAVPLVMTAAALLTGLFFAGMRRPALNYIAREETPELWRLWDTLEPPSGRKRRLLSLDEELGASIAERRAFLGLSASEVTLNLGLALLLAADVRALRAIIAHEVAHHRLQHTTGGTNIVEFERSFHMLFEYMDPETTITGRLAYLLLARLGDWLREEDGRLRRANEFAADQGLPDEEGRRDQARALVLVHAAGSFFEEEIVKPLQTELLGAVTVPPSPLARLIGRLDDLHRPETMAAHAQREWEKEADPDPNADHPSLKERLGALGFQELPIIEPVTVTAAGALLPGPFLDAQIEAFEERWRAEMRPQVEQI